MKLSQESYLNNEQEEAIEYVKYSYFNHFEGEGMEINLDKIDMPLVKEITADYDKLVNTLAINSPIQQTDIIFKKLTRLLEIAAKKLD